MFCHISKHLKDCQKYYTAHHVFNSLLSIWKICGRVLSLMFDILLKVLLKK